MHGDVESKCCTHRTPKCGTFEHLQEQDRRAQGAEVWRLPKTLTSEPSCSRAKSSRDPSTPPWKRGFAVGIQGPPGRVAKEPEIQLTLDSEGNTRT